MFVDTMPLPIDLMREIFMYDGTYKEMYGDVVKEAFDGERVRALKTFLTRQLHFPATGMFDGWLSMKSFSHGGQSYHEVTYPDSKTMMFHVMSIEEKGMLDDLSDPTSPKVLANMFHKLSDNVLLGFLNCEVNRFLRIKNGIKDKTMFNKVIMSMLSPKDYEDLVYHLQVHGTYEEEVHEHMFGSLVQDKFGKIYDEEQSVDYDYVAHDGKMYMVMWYAI